MKIKRKQKNFWTSDKIEFIIENLHKGIKFLALHFDVTETAIRIILKRNVHIKKSFMVHDYFTQQDIINELKAEGIYITRDILSSFAKNKYIKQIQISKKSIILYSEKDYLFLMDFFRSHTLLKESYKKIPKEYQKQFKGWISNNLINEIKTVRIRNSNLVYIENKSLAFAIDLLTNYLNSRDFGKMVYYSKCSILEKIRAGKIPALFFVGRYFIHKSEINKFR